MLGICQGVWENIFDIFFRPLKAISIKAFGRLGLKNPKVKRLN